MQGFPFDSQLTFDSDNNPIYDRAVSSQPLRKLIRDLFSTGVMPNPSTNLQVSAGTDGMTVQVAAGFAVIDGGLCQEAETRTLEVTAADNTYDRIDTVVVRWNENVDVRTADLYIKAGTPAASPVRPTLQRDNSIYEIGLADVFVTKKVATITNDKITDTRYESERCGVVSSVSEWDTTTIYQQVQADLAGFKAEEQAEFLSWFESIQNILDENVAAHLQGEVDDINGQLTATYDGDDIPFKFGIDENGDYGYYKAGADTVTPFKSKHTETVTPVIRDMIDLGVYHKVRYVDLSAVPNINSATQTISAVYTSGNGLDLGINNNVRYIKTSGLMVTPTGTKNITSNGNNQDVLGYSKINVSVWNTLNVQTIGNYTGGDNHTISFGANIGDIYVFNNHGLRSGYAFYGCDVLVRNNSAAPCTLVRATATTITVTGNTATSVGVTVYRIYRS